MARSSSGFVAGLTTAAIVAVGFLAYRASANVPEDLGKPQPTKSPTTNASKAPGAEDLAALPARSGTGDRVVYSLDDDRVWLVGANDRVRRTFEVTPGTVDPAPTSYKVTSRSGAVTGSDGVAIEHVVRFATVDGVAIGFSAAVDGSTAAPDASQKLGGIRQSREDGAAMWKFATVGTKVVVVE
ncbi:L,D-transpeptidase [Streptomyces sporangiiformans]|uniref:L,D-transpeptidase n=1 Tax=Streptomyces sporangiiformans TaxID=2315329 RepID=UPI0013C4DA92|nr:L,D-transpeptidase [Streptomyces sporangiiformans]